MTSTRLRLSRCHCHGVSQQNDWPDGDEQNHPESKQLGEVTRLCSVGISITEETRSANEHRVSSFHVHVNNRQRFESPRFAAKVTLLSPSQLGPILRKHGAHRSDALYQVARVSVGRAVVCTPTLWPPTLTVTRDE